MTIWDVKTKTVDYTTTTSDHTILVDCSGGEVTVTLLTAVGNEGQVFIIKKIDTTSNQAIVEGSGVEEIENSARVFLLYQGHRVVVQSDNVGYVRID